MSGKKILFYIAMKTIAIGYVGSLLLPALSPVSHAYALVVTACLAYRGIASVVTSLGKGPVTIVDTMEYTMKNGGVDAAKKLASITFLLSGVVAIVVAWVAFTYLSYMTIPAIFTTIFIAGFMTGLIIMQYRATELLKQKA